LKHFIREGAFSKVKLVYKIENDYRKRKACEEINKAKMIRLTLYTVLPC
jgi:hypothetical protein